MIATIRKIINLLKRIISERRLLMSFSSKDFQRRFAGSYFGIAWGFIQPLLTILVYLGVFQYGFRSGDVGSTPFVLWFVCGIVPWLFISEAITASSNCFLEYSYLVKKVVFSIEILPLVKIISASIIHLLFIGLLVIISCVYGYYPSIYFIQIIYYLFCIIIFVFSISLIFSSIMVFFRDLGQIISVLLLIGMWGTPIAWNVGIFPEKVIFWLKLNPFYYIVEGYRDCLVNHVWFWQKYYHTAYFWTFTFGVFIIGTFIYNRLNQHFADAL